MCEPVHVRTVLSAVADTGCLLRRLLGREKFTGLYCDYCRYEDAPT